MYFLKVNICSIKLFPECSKIENVNVYVKVPKNNLTNDTCF